MGKFSTIKNVNQEKEMLDRRTFVLSFLIITTSVLLLVRLIDLQWKQRSKYQTLSKQNQLTILPLSPNRGLIYDRNGLLLADNIPVYSLEVTPEQTHHLNATLKKLQSLIHISKAEVSAFKKLIKQRRPFDPIPLKIELSEEEIALFSVNKFKYPGFEVSARLIRHYPYANAFSHVLGYVAQISPKELKEADQAKYSASNFIGKIGLEKYYEDRLHGDVGFQKVEADATGRVIRTLEKNPPISGQNLQLTIDARLQNFAHELLDGVKGAIVAIDPHDGGILAMVSSPSFDPNDFVRGFSSGDFQKIHASNVKPLFNRTIRGQYPLASTIKPFLGLHGLESETITPAFKIWDPGWFKLPNSTHLYRDWKHTGHGWVDLKRSIIISCDTYYYHLAHLLGINQIGLALKPFGFGKKVGIDLGEELPGLVPSPEWKLDSKQMTWFPGDTLNSGIGQGYMLATPLQLAFATSTLANRGTAMRPHLVQENDEEIKPIGKINFRHSENWETVIDAMQGVIRDNEGTGYRFGRHPSYTVAGKTGTAQVYSAKHHDFDKDEIPENLRDHSLFIAFAPVKNPQIALAIIVEHSPTAGKMARDMLDYYLLNLRRKTVANNSHRL